MPEVDIRLFVPGVLLALFGWLIYFAGLQITGALLGGTAGASLALLLCIAFGVRPDLWISISIALGGSVGAIIGVFLIFKVARWFFILVGLIIGAFLAYISLDVARLISPPFPYDLIYRIGLVLLCGFLFWKAHHLIICLITAVGGGVLVLRSLDMNPLSPYLSLSVGALVFQLLLLRLFKGRRKERD